MGNMAIEVFNDGSKQPCKVVGPAPVIATTTIICQRKLTGDKLKITLHPAAGSTVQLKLCDVGVYGGRVFPLFKIR